MESCITDNVWRNKKQTKTNCAKFVQNPSPKSLWFLGGTWLVEHRSQALDVVKVAIKPKSESETWRLRHDLPKSSHLQLSLCGHGLANDLARAWCHRHYLWQLGFGCEGPGHCHYSEFEFADDVLPEALNCALETLKKNYFNVLRTLLNRGRTSSCEVMCKS